MHADVTCCNSGLCIAMAKFLQDGPLDPLLHQICTILKALATLIHTFGIELRCFFWQYGQGLNVVPYLNARTCSQFGHDSGKSVWSLSGVLRYISHRNV